MSETEVDGALTQRRERRFPGSIYGAGMRIRVLGASGTYMVPGRPSSSLVVEDSGTVIWVDAGFGTFESLCRGFSVAKLDAVVITHEHPDHSADFFALYHRLAYGPKELGRIPVFTTGSAVERIAGFLGAGDDHQLFDLFDFRRVAGGDMAEVNSLKILFGDAYHSVPALVVRFESADRTIAYSGDTGDQGAWPELVTGADVFICEASRQDGDETSGYPYHLTAARAAAIAREREAKRLVLTHIPPHLDPVLSIEEAERVFDRPVTLATPGQIL